MIRRVATPTPRVSSVVRRDISVKNVLKTIRDCIQRAAAVNYATPINISLKIVREMW